MCYFNTLNVLYAGLNFHECAGVNFAINKQDLVTDARCTTTLR